MRDTRNAANEASETRIAVAKSDLQYYNRKQQTSINRFENWKTHSFNSRIFDYLNEFRFSHLPIHWPPSRISNLQLNSWLADHAKVYL